ncbi:uncharacterized protein PGTG_00254 [Puccinia graminis f. sp. tritici CRL 75-36-700-3]|uniref:GB1/RHD3-type G domain-containing protein n=1 Tax=Puccinia graminis f. sp. tritici (strain CRL 75-36-700-3 / race SCCL) TaxID=418459 RepID=E3JQJ3_PUCGT|nr:uncharacterized protein PGTG_00254 [Puccinia graminis f. sp. tritici CRL 75-36-700-3]EFP74298.2 hypothetical protein PGTG_00254 [Puccinia graminis f. sp. tritici CRL 75-36-700-3]
MMAEPLQNTNGYRHHTEQVQVIGEEQRFTDVLPKSIESWGLLEKGFNYDVVAVFGSQSTGKSTLLNRVFGTTFDVMNEAERRQTTKGIWMCKGKDMDVLVMDVEGADGRERGEDQDFERKAALFSMASSEVIIVNMWEHQVGLYQGANMGLLRTVFEVDLALFQANKAKQRTSTAGYDKTHLLFVIRDHVGSTPLSNLENTITTDLNRIWDTLVKPEGTESSKITDYFDLTFTALSHKILQPENFDREVENFRRRFVDKTHPDYVFKPIYHKRIPADGLAQYMSGIWDAVVSNKDLDLPTQQELLAQFRCDEIAATSFEQFTTLIQPLKTKMESGKLVDELGTKMLEARRTCLASFDLAASRYHTGVYQRKRTEFMTKMNSNLSPLFLAQLKILSKSIIKRFQAELIHELKTGSGVRDFKEVVSSQMQASQNEFEDGVKRIKQTELSNRLKKESDAYYLEAKRSLVSSISQIPYWMYAVIAILGWNEFLAVLKSPVYFATILILAFGVWVTFKLNMQGPIVAIGTGLYHETSKVAQEKLKEYLSEVPSGQNRSGFTNSTTDTDEVYHLKKETVEQNYLHLQTMQWKKFHCKNSNKFG